jgi:CMP-N-acetylneuraminic acid synthetase
MSNAVAIIPARGGSKRLPRKNIVDFLGRPIIAYTIDAARDSGCFERIVVSTEDDEIVAIAERAGAMVDRRAPELATDGVGLVDVCLDFLDREAGVGRNWDVMACLYATAPLRNAKDIRATMALLEPGRCAFSMAVTSYERYPHQALKFCPGGYLCCRSRGVPTRTLVLWPRPVGSRHAARTLDRYRYQRRSRICAMDSTENETGRRLGLT